MASKIECSICLEELNGPNSETVALGCGHVFDRTCIDQCFNVTKTCPICKRRGFQYETRRLYFSSRSCPSERDDSLIMQLKQTVERQRLKIEAALAERDELQKSFVEDIKTLEEKHRRREAGFAAMEENTNRIHTAITKGLHQEIENYEKQLLIANKEIKILSTMPENKKRIGHAGSKKEVAQEDIMEQRVKKLEKQVQDLQISTKKKYSEGTSSKRRPNKSKDSQS